MTFTVLLVMPSLVTAIVVEPTPTPVIKPVDVTVAVLASAGVHITELVTEDEVPSLYVAMAVNC